MGHTLKVPSRTPSAQVTAPLSTTVCLLPGSSSESKRRKGRVDTVCLCRSPVQGTHSIGARERGVSEGEHFKRVLFMQATLTAFSGLFKQDKKKHESNRVRIAGEEGV